MAPPLIIAASNLSISASTLESAHSTSTCDAVPTCGWFHDAAWSLSLVSLSVTILIFQGCSPNDDALILIISSSASTFSCGSLSPVNFLAAYLWCTTSSNVSTLLVMFVFSPINLLLSIGYTI